MVIIAIFCLLSFETRAQDQIRGTMSYGFVDEESGLLVARTDQAFYTIGAKDDSFNEIPTGEMDEDSISYFKGTQYMKILTPGLIIVDKMKNEIVFSQYNHRFSALHHVSILPELDAFFLIASEGDIKAPEMKEKKKGIIGNPVKGLKAKLSNLSNKAEKSHRELQRFGVSDSISFNLIHMESGEVLWKYYPDADQGEFFTAPSDMPRLITDDKVVFPFGDNFYCLDASLGSLHWKYPYKRPGLLSSLASFFTSQQPSGYYVNITDEPGLVIFENYKRRKEDRVKELTMVNADGKMTWNVPLEKEEFLQSFWRKHVLVSSKSSARLIDLSNGSNRWGEPFYTKKENLKVNVGGDFFLLEENEKSERRYPLDLLALDPLTGQPTWEVPQHYASPKNYIRYRPKGILSYDKAEKELTFMDYKTGKSIWEYPKNSLYSYSADRGNYYMLTKDGVERLDEEGNKVWKEVVPMKKQRSLWGVLEEDDNKIIVTMKSEEDNVKQVNYVSDQGKLLFQKKSWKVGKPESLIFKKIIDGKLFYLTKSGFYKTDLKSDEKTEQLAKFDKEGVFRVINDDKSLMAIRSENTYYYLDLKSGDFGLLAKNLKFKGKDETRYMSFVGREGVLIQNRENVAFTTLKGELKYNKYFKYPEASQLGLKVLKAAINTAVLLYQVNQAGNYYGDAGSYYASGDLMFMNNANGHAENIMLSGMVKGLANNRINDFTDASNARRRMAENIKPVAIFAVKREYGEKKEVVLVVIDPATGNEQSEHLLGEKNPVFYVDNIGRIVYFIDKNQFVNRMKI
ncbi:MAG: hypothetical protein Roseis2KO_42650 [Roseivirga sp.]